MLAFEPHERSWQRLSELEWLATNGIGGYASGSLSGAPTRRYHGLLVASLAPPTHRIALVQRIEEEVSIHGQPPVSLSACGYPGAVHPQGFQYLDSFDRDPLPTFTYSLPIGSIRKTIWMPNGQNTTVVEYTNTGASVLRLRLRPLLLHRDYHSLQSSSWGHRYYASAQGEQGIRVQAYFGATSLYVGWSTGQWHDDRNWYFRAELTRERERGFDHHEDSISIGFITAELAPKATLSLVLSTEPHALATDLASLKLAELDRLKELTLLGVDQTHKSLLRSADQFLVRRSSTKSTTILAGYHWFTDWGRDTMIAMRGLCLATGRIQEARSILSTFLASMNRGMVPNRFTDDGAEPEYNTIDATLWLFVSVYEYWQRSRDDAFVREHWETLKDSIRWHRAGTRYGIRQTPEGLLAGGEHGVQLTWMDAKVGDWVVTPRQGSPVEVNALWYNSLRCMEHLAAIAEPALSSEYQHSAENTKAAFESCFWLETRGYLADFVSEDGSKDSSIRPNQIYALSLPFALLSGTRAQAVLACVELHLLTPYGLRTLSPEHADFRPTYAGGPLERDGAYHQGTVWPFLLGEYLLAYLYVHGHTTTTHAYVRRAMAPLLEHFECEGCIDGIAEVFDGESPEKGKGTVHQAWSLSALLQVIEVLVDSKKSRSKQPKA